MVAPNENDELPDASVVSVNPYSAPISTPAAVDSGQPVFTAEEVKRHTRIANIYSAIGFALLLAIGMSFFLDSPGLYLLTFLSRVIWLAMAIRLTRRKPLNLSARIAFAFVSALHIVIVSLEVIAILLIAVCLAGAIALS